jgi:hypothetical protein
MTTLNDRSMKRINFETNLLSKSLDRLASLKEGTPSFQRCLNRINTCRETLVTVQLKLEQRMADPSSLKRPRNGEEFEVMVGEEPSDESMVEVTLRVCKHEQPGVSEGL